MSYLSSLDTVFKIVKNLVDQVRCPICDKPEGFRSRYSCGHIVCDECMTIAEGCVLCLTPPKNSAQNKLRQDNPLSDRVKNAYNLLKVCQDTFHIDVYRRLRVSDQLKKEKEVFPECIQAPAKYFNKRKSLNISHEKENKLPSIFPGEIISPSKQVKMKKHNNFIQQWLNENETSRRALSDLNVNQQSYSYKAVNQKSLNRKRIHSLSPVSKYEKNICKNYGKKIRNENSISILRAKDQEKLENDESGIVLDDEPIYIDDSQSPIIDKDKLAFLAVEAADKERRSRSNSLMSFENTNVIDSMQNNKLIETIEGSTFIKLDHANVNSRNVPFLKMCSLVETCSQCQESYVDEDSTLRDEAKNVSISIDSKDFVTTINISNCNSILKNKSTVFVQTDIKDVGNSYEKKEYIPNLLTCNKDAKSNIQVRSQDLFLDADKCGPEQHNLIASSSDSFKKKDELKRHIPSKGVKKTSVVINESDSDSVSESATIFEVSADIHRSCDSEDYGILHEICTEELACRSKRKRRGATPDSSNSSEKENCDPNKQKKRKYNIKKKNSKVKI